MTSTKKILDQMRREPANIRYSELFKVCEELFWGTTPVRYKSCRIQNPLAG